MRKAYEWVFATMKLRGQFAFHDVEVIGNTAWVRTTSTGHVSVIATGAEGDVANSELFVLKLDEGGAWKIHRYIEAAKGLAEIFGAGRIQSFPGGFDEEAYARAEPHFEAMLQGVPGGRQDI